MRKNHFGCRVSCTGLYADISHDEGNPDDASKDGAMVLDSEVFSQLKKDYQTYKSKFVKNLKFNATSPTLGTFRKHSNADYFDILSFHSSYYSFAKP